MGFRLQFLMGLILLFCSSCGREICVMGVGACDFTGVARAPGSTTTTNRLYFSLTLPSVGPSKTTTLYITGGTSPYSAGSLTGGSIVAVDTANTQFTVTAPATVGTYTINATDASGYTGTVLLKVE